MATGDDDTDALYSALRHPRRRQILALLWRSERALSPAEIGDALDEAVTNTSYNIRVVLQGAGLVSLVRTEPIRGSVEHFYELTKFARASDVVRKTVEATDIPLRLPEPRTPPTEETFNRFAYAVLTDQERRIVELRRGWNGRPQLSRRQIEEDFGIGGHDLRRIERAGLYKIERAKYESDRAGAETLDREPGRSGNEKGGKRRKPLPS